MAPGVTIWLRRAILTAAVFVVLLGLVGMHQLVTASASHTDIGVEHTMTAGHNHQPDPSLPTGPAPLDERSTLLHLCLAVLAAVGLLLVARAVLATVTVTLAVLWAPDRCLIPHSRPRSPPASRNRLLAQLCVLRR